MPEWGWVQQQLLKGPVHMEVTDAGRPWVGLGGRSQAVTEVTAKPVTPVGPQDLGSPLRELHRRALQRVCWLSAQGHALCPVGGDTEWAGGDSGNNGEGLRLGLKSSKLVSGCSEGTVDMVLTRHVHEHTLLVPRVGRELVPAPPSLPPCHNPSCPVLLSGPHHLS